MKNINTVASLKNICSKHGASFFLSFLILFLLSIHCNHSTPPNNDNTNITITAEDASCIEAWLNVKLNNFTLPQQFNLFENDSLKTNLILLGNDTTILVEGLLPKKNYRYKLTYAKGGGEEKSSNEITVETMDTTSHNFTWQTFTFGQHSSSTLYDVAIINENNIWAVGEIYMNDSLGNPDPHAYNAVHWDGSKWELKKIGNQGGWACHTVFAFSENDVWFEGVIKWDGVKYKVYNNGFPLEPNGDGWQINKMWGSSSNDLYAVGNGGNIAHWDGVKWSKIESETDLPINDIWGDYNEETTEWEILAVASNIYQFENKKILSISTTGVIELPNIGLPMDLGSIWLSNAYNSYVGGDGLYVKSYSKNYWSRIELPTYFIFSIRGNGLNDMIVCGGLGYIGHYNGNSWINYLDTGVNEIHGNYYSSAIKRNKFVAVGGVVGGKAVVIIGTR